MSFLTQLPTELLDPILFPLCAEDLANLALCSRSLNVLVTPYLYRAPSLLLTNISQYTSTVPLFLGSLLKKAHLRTLVHDLQIKTRLLPYKAWGRSRREYDTVLGDTVLEYVLSRGSGSAVEPELTFDPSIEAILEKGTNLKRFEIGDKSFASYFTYAFEYHLCGIEEETTSGFSSSGSAPRPGQRLKSITISHHGSEGWASPSYSGLRIPFDHFPALLLTPSLSKLSIANLSNSVKVPSSGPDLGRETYWRTIHPFSQDPNPRPSMSITTLALKKTLILPRTLELILALTPRLKHLEYDCFMDFYYTRVETRPFMVSELNVALRAVQKTLRSLILKIKPFHLPLRSADGSGGEVEWLRGSFPHESDIANAEDENIGRREQYLDLCSFTALKEMNVWAIMPLFYGQLRRTDTAGLATFLPQSLERLYVSDTVIRRLGCKDEECWTEDDMVDVLSSLAREERRPRAFERLELDILLTQESWAQNQAQDLKTAYQEVGLECEVVSEWSVVLSEGSIGPVIIAHHC